MKFNKENFKLIRKNRKISLKKVTSQIGKSYRTLLAWEKGERNPGESDIRVLAQILDISVSEISDLKDLAIVNTPPYNHPLGTFEQLNREFIGELSIEKQAYLLNLKNELEHLTSEVNMLRQVNNRQKLVIDSIHSFIYVKDVNLIYIDANSSYLAYLNIPLKKLIGQNSYNLFTSKDIEKLCHLEREVINQGVSILNHEIIIPNSNGKKKGIISICPVYDKDDKVSQIICNLRDIPDISAQQKRRKMMEFAINKLNDAVWIMENKPIPHFIFISNALAIIYDRPIDEFYSNQNLWFELVHPDDKNRVSEILQGKKVIPSKIQYRIILSDESIRWVELRAYKGSDTHYRDIIFGTITDITRFIEADQTKNLLHGIIDKFEDIVWVGSKNKQNKNCYNLDYINSKASVDIIGYNDTELYYDQDIWINSVHPDDKNRMIAEFATNKYPRNSTYRIIQRNGDIKYIEDREYKVNDELYFGFVKDTSNNKHNDELLKYFKDSVNLLNGVFWIKQIHPIEKIIFIADAIENIIGYSPQDITSEIWHQHILNEDRLRVKKAYSKITERNIPLAYKLRHKNGSIHYVDEVWFKIQETKTTIIKFGFLRDNSE